MQPVVVAIYGCCYLRLLLSTAAGTFVHRASCTGSCYCRVVTAKLLNSRQWQAASVQTEAIFKAAVCDCQ
jgi:hypothetical protein